MLRGPRASALTWRPGPRASRGSRFRGLHSLVLGAVAVATLAALIIIPTQAHAASPARGTGFELRFGLGFSATTRIPTLRLSDDVSLSSRELVSGTLPTAGGFRGLGGHADLAYVVRPRLTVPLVGLGFYGAVGDHAPVRSAVDGTIATVQPWRMFAVDVLGPGLGLRFTHRRYFFEVTARIGAVLYGGKAELAAGREAVDTDVVGLAFSARAELSGCRRLDPENRLCLSLTPRLYEVRPLSGASLNVTWVWGN